MAYPLNSKQEHRLLRDKSDYFYSNHYFKAVTLKQGPETGNIGIAGNLLAIQILMPADQNFGGEGPGHCR